MKILSKFIVLFIVLFIGTLNVNGQVWNLSNTSLAGTINDGITEGYTVEGKTLSMRGKMIFINVSETIDDVTYTKAIYGDGTSNSDGTKIPTRRFLSFEVSDKGTLDIIATSRNINSNTYDVMLEKIGGVIENIGSATYTSKTIRKETFNIPEAGTVYIYYKGTKDIAFCSISYTELNKEPGVMSFEVEGVEATIDNQASTITAELPFGTDLISITPTITLEGTAKSYSPTGAQDFSNSVLYSIYASEDGSGAPLKTYTVTLTAASVVSSDATLSDLTIDGLTVADFTAEITDYSIEYPYGSAIPVVDAVATSSAASLAITQATSMPGQASVLVTAQNGVTKTYTINFTVAAAPKFLTKVVFSNGFEAFIKQEAATVVAHYSAGTTAPTIDESSITFEGASVVAATNGSKITVTGADGLEKEFTVSLTAVSPFTSQSTNTVTFDGAETWIKTGYDFDLNGRGWRFAKDVEETSNRRVSEGKTRIYFFVGACDKLTFTSGSGGNRAIKVYVEGVEQTNPTSTGAKDTTFDVEINSDTPSMIAIVSNQTSGDGGVTKMTLTPRVGTSLSTTNASSALYFDGKTILNPTNRKVNVYNVSGSLVVSSSSDIDMKLQTQGFYIVKSGDEIMKIHLR